MGNRGARSVVYQLVRWPLLVVLIACKSEPPKPTTQPPLTSAAPSTKPSTADVIGLAVGLSHTCALHADGNVSCWGANDSAQLGVPTAKLERSLYPLAMPGIHGDAIEISGESNTTCIRKKDDTAWCWGFLGDHSIVPEPSQVADGIVQLAGRCFRTRDGHAQCLNRNAQLFTIEGLDEVVHLAADDYERGCAARKDGSVKCWFGANHTTQSVLPVKDATDIVQVAVGGQLCGLTRGGAVRCWAMIDATSMTQALDTMPAVKDARAIVANDSTTCVRTADNIECWQDNNDESLKKLDAPPTAALAPGLHTCFAKGPRDVRCWGNMVEGELGNGWWRRRPLPTRVPGLTDVVELGGSHRGTSTCARKRDGTVACWGSFPLAPVVEPKTMPIKNVIGFGGIETIRLIDDKHVLHEVDYNVSLYAKDLAFKVRAGNVAMANDYCFVTTAGRARCWRTYMQADPADTRYTLMPKIEDAVEVSAYSEQGMACARHRDNHISCFNQGSDAVRDTPAFNDVVEIAVSEFAQCVIRADHSLWCWGSTTTPIFTPRPTPQDVEPTKVPVGDVATMSLGRENICVVRTSGTVACWGANSEGQLGDGTLLPRSLPADVVGITDAVDVQVGLNFACAAHRDGEVSCWGITDHGQIGTMATADVLVPQAVVWP